VRRERTRRYTAMSTSPETGERGGGRESDLHCNNRRKNVPQQSLKSRTMHSVRNEKRRFVIPTNTAGCVGLRSARQIMPLKLLTVKLKRTNGKSSTFVVPVETQVHTLRDVRNYLREYGYRVFTTCNFRFLDNSNRHFSLAKEVQQLAWKTKRTVRWKHHTFPEWNERDELDCVEVTLKHTDGISAHKSTKRGLSLVDQFRRSSLKLQRDLIVEYLHKERALRNFQSRGALMTDDRPFSAQKRARFTRKK